MYNVSTLPLYVCVYIYKHIYVECISLINNMILMLSY